VAPEAAPDRLGRAPSSPSMINKRGTAGSRPRLDQVVDQCLHHGGCARLPPPSVRGGCLNPALSIPSAATSHEVLADVDAVDLHHHDVGARIDPHPSIASCAQPITPRSAAEGRPTSTPRSPPARRNIAPREAAPPRRNFRVEDVDQHEAHRPLAPTNPPRPHGSQLGKREFLRPPRSRHAGPLNRHLAAWKPILPWGSAPAMTAPAIAAGTWRAPQASSASFSIMVPSASIPARQAETDQS